MNTSHSNLKNQFEYEKYIKNTKNTSNSLYLVHKNKTIAFSLSTVWQLLGFFRNEWGFISLRLLYWSLLRISLWSCITNNKSTLSTNKLDVSRVCLFCRDFTSLTDSLFRLPNTVPEKPTKCMFVSFPAIRCNLARSNESQNAYVKVFKAVRSYRSQNSKKIHAVGTAANAAPSLLLVRCPFCKVSKARSWEKTGRRQCHERRNSTHNKLHWSKI